MENMTQILIRIIIPIFIAIVLVLLGYSIQKRNSNEFIKNLKKDHIVIRLPKVYFYVGLIGFLFSVLALS